MHKYTVAFRIEGMNLDPLVITETLKLTPRQTRNADHTRARNKTALWEYGGKPLSAQQTTEWKTIDAGLTHLLKDLLPLKNTLDSLRSQFNMYWWCGHFHSSFDGGPVFPPSLLNQLSEIGATLYLDTYFFEED